MADHPKATSAPEFPEHATCIAEIENGLQNNREWHWIHTRNTETKSQKKLESWVSPLVACTNYSTGFLCCVFSSLLFFWGFGR